MQPIFSKELSAILWDLDGTLIDTAKLHWLAFNQVLAGYGHPVTWEKFVLTFGLRNDVGIPLYMGPLDPESIQRIADEKEEHFRALLLQEGNLRLLPGAANCLERFRAAGYRQALATMSPCQNVELIVETLSIRAYFTSLVTGDDVQRSKPEPDIFLEAARRLEMSPGQCLVIEDSRMGVEAARRAGMRVVGVGAAIPQGEADLLVASLEQLCDRLRLAS